MNKKISYLPKVLSTTILLACFSMNASAVVISSTDVPKSIPDNNPAGITSVLTVGSDFIISDLNLELNVSHTCVPDLHIGLTSPGGTTSTLIKAANEGGILFTGCTDNFDNTVLDDDALTNLFDGTAPYTGSFNVEHSSVVSNPLSVFDGESAYGTWTLFVADLAEEDVGRLSGWSLEFESEQAPIPEPGTIVLLSLGLAGFGLARNKKQH